MIVGAILAGGYGKRLKPITDEIPKVLVEIKQNFTIMDRQILDFKYLGIKDVYILSGHLGDKIEERYGKEYQGITFHYLRERKPMGTLYSIRNLLEQLHGEDVILRNGDTISDINFNIFRDFASSSAYGMVMLITRMKSPYGIVETNGDQVVSFREKPILDHYINSGLYYIKSVMKETFSAEYNGKDVEITAFPEIAKRKLLGAYIEDALWIGVDSEKELEQARKEYVGREDTEYGYRKEVYGNDKIHIIEYLVKEGREAVLSHECGKIVRFLSGDGLVEGEKRDTYAPGTVVKIEMDLKIRPNHTTRLEVISD